MITTFNYLNKANWMDQWILHLNFLICLFSHISPRALHHPSTQNLGCLIHALLCHGHQLNYFLTTWLIRDFNSGPPAQARAFQAARISSNNYFWVYITDLLGRLEKKETKCDVHLDKQSHKQENVILELGKGEKKNIQVEWLRGKKKVKFSFLGCVLFWLCWSWLMRGLLLL